jgi:hypothetical protein
MMVLVGLHPVTGHLHILRGIMMVPYSHSTWPITYLIWADLLGAEQLYDKALHTLG